MSITHFLRNCMLTLAVSVAATAPLTAQSYSQAAIESLKDKLEDFDVQAQRFKRELEFITYKRQSTETKLKQSQRDLKDKEADLQRLRATLGNSPSSAQADMLANEQQRVALAELNIKSLLAAVVRLERKEEELRTSLSEIETQKQTTTQSIANAEKRARAQAAAKAQAVEAELEALKRENERLRLAMEEEAQRAQEAAAQARLLAEQEQARLAQEAEERANATAMLDAEKLPPEAEAQPVAPRPGLPDDEPPIHIADDGVQVVIRSRSLDAPVTMQPVGSGIYQAEVVVEPGRAYFDVRNQRFRGHFPKTDTPQAYLFTYDTSGESPTFLVGGKSKGQQDPQMVTDSHDPF